MLRKKNVDCLSVCVVLKEAFGFIERADVVKEIFFHYSEFKGDLEALQAGDDVEFTIKDRNVGIRLRQTILRPLGGKEVPPLF